MVLNLWDATHFWSRNFSKRVVGGPEKKVVLNVVYVQYRVGHGTFQGVVGQKVGRNSERLRTTAAQKEVRRATKITFNSEKGRKKNHGAKKRRKKVCITHNRRVSWQ